ncbi:MAG TPA: hypothetical protein VGH87_11815, partial [Polyangiaceae bacterium]
AACSHDGDCVVSNFGGCCTSCQATAYAATKHGVDQRNRMCAVVDCAFNRTRCEPVIDASLYRAVCRAHKCAGIKR